MPEKKEPVNKTRILQVIVIIAIIAVVAIAVVKYANIGGTHSVTTVTTVPVQKLSDIDSCTNITTPGVYYLTGDISTGIQSGACIDVMTGGVTLEGNNHQITGNGPFVDLPPFTYGIFIANVSNVTIRSLTISKFTYGIYLNGTSGSTISGVTVKNSTITSLYMLSGSNNTVSKSVFTGSASAKGSVILQRSSGSDISDSSIGYSNFYGLVVNSTGNKFINDTITNNPVDLFCSGNASFANYNRFSGTCTVNNYCNFAVCSQTNLPASLSAVKLSSPISTCGSITTPGTYVLSNDLNALNYISSANANSTACITIASSNVRLECQNRTISNSGFGVLAENSYNVTVQGCGFENDTEAVYMQTIVQGTLSNSRITGGTYGIHLVNSTLVNIANVSQSGGSYGLYTNSTAGVYIRAFNSTGNAYGSLIDNTTAVSFSNSSLTKNTAMDLYCTSSTYNGTNNNFKNTSCGVTDCNWASCNTKVLPPLPAYPVMGCMNITAPGAYSLRSNISSSSSCFRITASNVSFNCELHSVGSNSSRGSGFLIAGVSNVSVSNCRLFNFKYGINVTGSSHISMLNTTINSTDVGVSASNSSSLYISKVRTGSYANYGFIFSRISASNITRSLANVGTGANSTGIYLSGSTNNTITFDNFTSGTYGVYLNNSGKNYIRNNSAYFNKLDFYCSPSVSGINAESGYINVGNTKNNCEWLVLLSPTLRQQSCQSITLTSGILLTQDMVYPYGSTCFNVYQAKNATANNTVINCQGHTVYAPDGGTFVNVENSSGVILENCYLKNFTNPIIVSAPFVTVRNLTITASNVPITSIDSFSPAISDNNVTASAYGILSRDNQQGSIFNNSISAYNGIYVYTGKSMVVAGNRVHSTSDALLLSNVTFSQFKNNLFDSSASSGIACTASSSNSSSLNSDSGQNSCSSNSDCLWMSSSQCRPS